MHLGPTATAQDVLRSLPGRVLVVDIEEDDMHRTLVWPDVPRPAQVRIPLYEAPSGFAERFMGALILEGATALREVDWKSASWQGEWLGAFPPKTGGWFLGARNDSTGPPTWLWARRFDDIGELTGATPIAPALGRADITIEWNGSGAAPTSLDVSWMDGPRGLPWARSVALENGRAEIADLPAGRYRVRLTGGRHGVIETDATFVVPAGGSVEAVVAVSPVSGR